MLTKRKGFLLTGCIVFFSEAFAMICPDDKRSTLESECNTDVRDDWWSGGGGGGEVFRAKPLDMPNEYTSM